MVTLFTENLGEVSDERSMTRILRRSLNKNGHITLRNGHETLKIVHVNGER